MGMPSVTYASVRLLGLAVIAALVHCGGSLSIGSDEQPVNAGADGGRATAVDGSAARDASTESSVVVVDADAGPDTIGNFGTVLCQWGMPINGVVPAGTPTETYGRQCAVASDCAIGKHLADCCGSEIALGVRADQASRFTAVGGICGAEFAACDCAGRPMQADNGHYSGFADGRDIVVTCSSGVCQTKVSSFACGNKQCDPQTQFCEVFPPGIAFPDGGTPPSSYACSPLPAGCTAAPTCACVKPSTSNVQSCADGSGGVTVTHWGI